LVRPPRNIVILFVLHRKENLCFHKLSINTLSTLFELQIYLLEDTTMQYLYRSFLIVTLLFGFLQIFSTKPAMASQCAAAAESGYWTNQSADSDNIAIDFIICEYEANFGHAAFYHGCTAKSCRTELDEVAWHDATNRIAVGRKRYHNALLVQWFYFSHIAYLNHRDSLGGELKVVWEVRWDDGRKTRTWTEYYSRLGPKVKGYKLVNYNSNLCLGIQNMSHEPGAPALQWSCTGTADHYWRLSPTSGGRYKLINNNSDQCLGIQNMSHDPGAPALQWPCTGTTDHFWEVVPAGPGRYKLVNDNSNLCLGIEHMSFEPGAPALQWTCTGTADHFWYLVPQ
jgi:hypothetical protein